MIEEAQLASLITAALNAGSDNNANPAQARIDIGLAFASGVAQFVQGRTATGPTTDGATANVIIQ